MNPKIKRISALLWAVLMLCACGAQPAEIPSQPPEQPAPTEESTPPSDPTEEVEAEPERFVLTFVGDCTFGSSEGVRYLPTGFRAVVGEDYRYPFENVVGYFENDDFTMANLEGVLGDRGSPITKNHNLRGSEDYVNILTENAVEAVTLANNHTMDYGLEGYNRTVEVLEKAGVAYVEENNTLLYTTERGLRIGIYGAAFGLPDIGHLRQQVALLRQQGAELIILTAHWGLEQYYVPYKEQRQAAYDAIDAGVDIVYASHPHVLQPIVEYNGGIIYFSLGNFSFGGNIYPADYDTAIVQQEILRGADGTVTLGELTVIPASCSSSEFVNDYRPTPYPEGSEGWKRVIQKLEGTWPITAIYY